MYFINYNVLEWAANFLKDKIYAFEKLLNLRYLELDLSYNSPY